MASDKYISKNCIQNKYVENLLKKRFPKKKEQQKKMYLPKILLNLKTIVLDFSLLIKIIVEV